MDRNPAPHVLAAIQRCQPPRPTPPALPGAAIQPRLADSLRAPAPPRPAASLPSQIIQGFFQGGRPRLNVAPGSVQLSRGHAVQVPSGAAGIAPHGPGERLPAAVQAKMEAFFGASFGDVRVHVGPQPAALGAVAFTQGSNIFFAHGQYAPQTPHGQRLLAHELTHVVQQRSGQVRNPFGGGVTIVHDPGLEAEAERRGALIAHFQLRPNPAAPVPAPQGPAAVSFDALQMAKKTKTKTRTKAMILYGTESWRIRPIKKYSSSKIGNGDYRVNNVRGLVRFGNKRGRKSTTNHKTTTTSSPLNNFLKNAKLYSTLTRFEGGHAIADVYGGPTSPTNTFPLPHAFNTIAYKKEEHQLKKTLTDTDTAMEVSIQYPEDPLEGLLTPKEQKALEKKVGKIQVDKLRDLYSQVPGWIAWEVNDPNGGKRHNWVEFDDIREDLFPRGTKPKNLVNNVNFLNAVRKL